MLEIEEWFMIRELHAQGLNITEISDKTGYDRKTDYIIKKLQEGPFTDFINLIPDLAGGYIKMCGKWGDG
ncbi:Uncharacterised protein [uncultured archaeon]|nr:Uncharacterised protein [uncultured archaeon]